ncbi:MAG: substrate-binding domain-containing protein [Spirochaetales bacterium]|nr:substrate-binding domain-containing protein [Spirochaetales bacterium]
MPKFKKRPLIGYYNITISQDWGFLPWRGMLKAAKSHNIDTISFIGEILNHHDPLAHQSNAVYDLHKRGYLDGLILWGGHFTANLSHSEVLDYVKQFQLPMVFLENYNPIPGIPSLLGPNYDGIKMMMDHLVQIHGYKKIGFMGQDQAYIGFTHRYQAYVDALKAYGLELDPRLIGPWLQWVPVYDGRSNDQWLDEWLPKAMDAGLEAILCLADPIAWWVIERLNGLGYRVPEDVAVVGFDGFIDSKLMNPPLTTLDPHFEESGHYAVKIIVDLLKGKKVPDKVFVPPELFIGRTCGCFDLGSMHIEESSGDKKKVKKHIIGNLQSLLPHEKPESLEKLHDAFSEALQNKSAPSFLGILEQKLSDNLKQGIELTPRWQEALNCLNGVFVHSDRVLEKQVLCHQARILVNNASVRQQGSIRYQSIARALTETEVSTQILNNFELSKVLDLLAVTLPRIGIRRCYLALFDEPFTYKFPDSLPDTARLVLGFDEFQRMDLGPQGQLMATYKIIPECIYNAKASSHWLVFSLHFSEKQIGFVVFDSDVERGVACEFLKVFISRSLQSVFLIRERTKAVENLEKIKARLQSELKTAQNIQNSLLPKIPEHPLFDIFAVLKPSLSAGSNFYDIIENPRGEWFIIGDVHGQGIYAGLIMLKIQTASHLLINKIPEIRPHELLNRVSEVIQENNIQFNANKVISIMIFNHLGKGVFCFSGNSLQFLVYRHAKGKVELIEINSSQERAMQDENIPSNEGRVALEQGDCLLGFTSGLIKAVVRSGQSFGMNHLINIFQASGHKAAEDLIDDILAELHQNDLDEDISLMAIKWPFNGPDLL